MITFFSVSLAGIWPVCLGSLLFWEDGHRQGPDLVKGIRNFWDFTDAVWSGTLTDDLTVNRNS